MCVRILQLTITIVELGSNSIFRDVCVRSRNVMKSILGKQSTKRGITFLSYNLCLLYYVLME